MSEPSKLSAAVVQQCTSALKKPTLIAFLKFTNQLLPTELPRLTFINNFRF